MSSLNLGVVAHVDAGKTSLTERLLYEAGVIDAPGRVDDGTTRTDSMDLERRRGITIRAAVTSFALGGLSVNIVDTPGHPDFIAEVERSLTVLDAAVLVLSSVEGVQPQTVVIWRALARIGVPTVLFINKVDRTGSDVVRVVRAIRARLTPAVVVLTDVSGEGHKEASVRTLALDDESVVRSVAEADDAVLARWAQDEIVGAVQIRGAIRRGIRCGSLTPVLHGSAITGAGVPELRQVLADLVPPAAEREGPPAATVFAVDRQDGSRRTWLRLWSGELRVRDRVALSGRPAERVTEIAVSRPGGPVIGPAAGAGEIAVVRGLSARVGDSLGEPPARRVHRFAPSTMQALLEPVDPADRSALFAALTELADEDPLIDLRLDQTDGEAAVSLHGEVQKEVIAALLEERYAVRARFLPTSVVCIERVVGTGEALEEIGLRGNPYLATIGLRVEAAPVGHGVEFAPGIERGNLPASFVTATEEGVRAAFRQGLSGWAVADCVVTMTASGYFPRQSHAHQKFSKAMSSVGADFRNLSQIVALAALQRARTRVCQPVDRFRLDVPDTALDVVAALLGRLGAVTLEASSSAGYVRLSGDLPATQVPDLAGRLPDLTGGEGVLVRALHHHAPVPTGHPVPVHRHSGLDPRDRDTWFRDVPR